MKAIHRKLIRKLYLSEFQLKGFLHINPKTDEEIEIFLKELNKAEKNKDFGKIRDLIYDFVDGKDCDMWNTLPRSDIWYTDYLYFRWKIGGGYNEEK